MKTNLAIGLVLATGAIYAQTPAFEVTSVKLNTLPPGQRRDEFDCTPNGRFVSLGVSLRTSFFWAFKLRPFQVTGRPVGSILPTLSTTSRLAPPARFPRTNVG